MDTDRLRGNVNQDQDMAFVNDIWSQTDGEAKDQLLSWLEMESDEEASDCLRDMPPRWIGFVRLCCAIGLREAILLSKDRS